MLSLHQRKVARVLFDESHGEAWTIRPDIAAAIQPEHAAGSSYARPPRRSRSGTSRSRRTAAGRSRRPRWRAPTCSSSPIRPTQWERTVGGGSPLLSPAEIGAVEAFVGARRRAGRAGRDRAGQVRRQPERAAGAVRRPHREHDRRSTTTPHSGTPTWVFGRADPPAADAGPAAPRRARLLLPRRRSGAPTTGAVVLRTGAEAEPAARRPARRRCPTASGRVVVAADADLFGDDLLGELDHRQLWLNLLYWVAAPAFRAEPEPIVSAAAGTTRPGRACATRPTRCAACRSPAARSTCERHDVAAVARPRRRP